MEKQPIDDLFARKLREAEQAPSPATFSRLQSRMISTGLPATKRRALGWWYGVAAATLLLMTLFYFRSVPHLKRQAPDQMAKQQKVMDPDSVSSERRFSQQVAKKRDGVQVTMSSVKQTDDAQHSKRTPVTVAKQITKKAESTVVAVVEKAPVRQTERQWPEPTPAKGGEASTAEAYPPLPVQAVQSNMATIASLTDHQRVVVMTIGETRPTETATLLPLTKAAAVAQTQPVSLAGLFAKMKQLKNGDVMARAVPQPNYSRSRLGRVFYGMKESLKNETTLD